MAVSLQRLQGSLQSHHALQLVGGTHSGSGVDTPTDMWWDADGKEGRREIKRKSFGKGDGGFSCTVCTCWSVQIHTNSISNCFHTL